MRNASSGQDVAGWNATVVKLSGVGMLLFGGLALVSVVFAFVKSRSLRPSALRFGGVTSAIGVAGAVGLLVSSATLYVTYRPYGEILAAFIQRGDETQIDELARFLFGAQIPLGAPAFENLGRFDYYFWAGVILVAAAALLLFGTRLFLNRPRASASA